MSTIPQMLLERVARDGGEPAFFARRKDVAWKSGRESPEHPDWIEMDLADLVEAVSGVARHLHDSGVRKGTKVAILSETSAMWSVIDLAIISLGAVTVGIYPTLPADQVRWLLEHSDSEFLVCENHAQWLRLGDLSGLGRLKQTRLIWEHPSGPETIEPAGPDESFLIDAINRVEADDLCTIVYTSGTTGMPKGAMLTHGNFMAVIEASAEVIPTVPGHRSVVFLPMAHSLQRFALYRGLYEEVLGYFCTIDDLRETLLVARPHILVTVPRMLEKIREQVLDRARRRGPKAERFLLRAIADSQHAIRLSAALQRVPLRLRARLEIAERLAFRKIRQGLGGDIETFVSGGAALDPELTRWFEAIGIEVLEGWGLTETSAPATANPAGYARPGSVGLPLRGVDVSTAPDGELRVRGPGVFAGYYKDPEATQAAFTEDGAFQTGDLGRIDDDGYIWITGRKKSILVTSGGKNIAPIPIEQRLRRDLIEQAVVVGDDRPYLVALICLSPPLLETLAHKEQWTGGPDDWRGQSEVSNRVRNIIDQANEGRASFESIKKFAILPRSLTIENDELTPTLKLRRHAVVTNFRNLVDSLYDA